MMSLHVIRGALGVALISLSAIAGQDPRAAWSHVGQVETPPAARRGVLGAIGVGALESPKAYASFKMDDRQMAAMLAAAPMEFTPAAEEAPTVMLPRPDGTLEAFALVESPVMHPLLAAKYPSIKTYAAQGIDNPAAVARVSMNELGFFATVLSPEGDYAVAPLEPVTALRNPDAIYASSYAGDINGPWECGFVNTPGPVLPDPSILVSTGPTLRTYQIACAMEAQMCVNLGGGTVAGGLSLVTTAVNATNVVWEKEFAIRLIMFPESDKIIFNNVATNPYDNSDNTVMLDENQGIIEQFSDAAYDIGHVIAWTGGGVASRGSACSPSNKGRGVSGNMFSASSFSNPQTFMHELGHQFNAPHSWNSPNGSCTAAQWGGSAAMEPGSGSTIMSYAGSCSPDNVQNFRDTYYSQGSQQQITDFAAALACTVAVATTNNAPVITTPVLNNDVIPIGTPFTLTASATDPDGDALTYLWEQRDFGSQRALSAGDGGTGPLFRSFPPNTTGTTRYFPKLSTILTGNLAGSAGEILPSTTRIIRFRFTARDNKAGGGGVNFVDRQIRSISTVGPFKITSPNTSGAQSGAVVVRWDVKNTNVTPFNHNLVNIWLSTNGGNTFPTLLKGDTPNDGVEPVILPQSSSSQMRIMVRPKGNIGDALYFDISDANMTLSAAPATARVASGGSPVIADSVGNGNANGVPEPGETNVQMWFDLLSTGLATATNVSATVQSLTAGVTVTQPNVSFDDMPLGALERNAFPALISVAPSVVCGSNASIRLNVTTAQGPFTINYTVKMGPTNNICAAPVAYCAGDLNDDGFVDDTDFVLFAIAYDLLNSGGGDLNFDTVTDDTDFVLFATAYNELICP
ncbi:MAG TPA: zinc-dependent metalloprotease family protein [Phycisphaerales bacterium]